MSLIAATRAEGELVLTELHATNHKSVLAELGVAQPKPVFPFVGVFWYKIISLLIMWHLATV